MPLIAASIVLVAALNLRRRTISWGPRVATVLGFNLGIEFGQALFVAAALAAPLIGTAWLLERVGV